MNILRHPALLSLAATMVLSACGGSSDTTDPVALCKKGCGQFLSLCFPDAGSLGATLRATCEMNCTGQATTGGKPCSNSAAQIAAYKVCQAKDTCDDLTACVATIPACAGGSGTGGATGSGTGGATSSSGGATGTGSGGASNSGGATGSAGRGGATGAAGRAGTGGGASGGTSGGGAACTGLLTCCNAITIPAGKTACLNSYTAVMSMGDAACTSALSQLRQAGVCP